MFYEISLFLKRQFSSCKRLHPTACTSERLPNWFILWFVCINSVQEFEIQLFWNETTIYENFVCKSNLFLRLNNYAVLKDLIFGDQRVLSSVFKSVGSCSYCFVSYCQVIFPGNQRKWTRAFWFRQAAGFLGDDQRICSHSGLYDHQRGDIFRAEFRVG